MNADPLHVEEDEQGQYPPERSLPRWAGCVWVTVFLGAALLLALLARAL